MAEEIVSNNLFFLKNPLLLINTNILYRNLGRSQSKIAITFYFRLLSRNKYNIISI